MPRDLLPCPRALDRSLAHVPSAAPLPTCPRPLPCPCALAPLKAVGPIHPLHPSHPSHPSHPLQPPHPLRSAGLTDEGKVVSHGFETFGGLIDFPFSAHPKVHQSSGDLVFHGCNTAAMLELEVAHHASLHNPLTLQLQALG